MRDASSRRRDVPVAGAVAFLAAALGLHPVITPDLWWHLASGRWILAHGAVPRTDPFTYTVTDHPWINLQWLGDVVTVTLYRWSGPDGLVLLKALVLAGIAALLFVTARRGGAGTATSGLVVTLGVLAGAERTMVRPEIASYLLLASTLLLVGEIRAGRRGPDLALPLLTVLWANVHSLAFLAPLTMLWHALWWEAPPHLAGPAALDRSRRRLLLAGGVSAAVLLLNPYGPAAWTFPLTLLERIRADAGAFHRILEFASPLDEAGDRTLVAFWILTAGTLLSAGAPGVRARGRRLASVAPFLLLALLARRNLPLFVIAAVPVLARNVTEATSSGARWSGRSVLAARALGGLVPAGLAVAILGGASPVLLGLHRDRGLGVSPGLFPDACVDALERRESAGALFNEMDFGGYLEWRLPGRRTFIDGRLEVAGRDLLHDYLRAHEDPVVWERTRRSWNIDTLLLHHAQPGSAAFLRALLGSGEWKLLCASAEAVLLGRSEGGPDARDLRPAPETWTRLVSQRRGPAPGGGRALAFVTDPLDRLLSPTVPAAAIHRAVNLAGLCLQLGWLDEARLGYSRVLAVDPGDTEALFNAGLCELRAGRPGAAREMWTAALERVPAGRRTLFLEALERLARNAPPSPDG